jgi:outer membrane protein assembly factor BamE
MFVPFPRQLLLLLLPFLTYCTYLPSFPYKIDIQQGNFVTEEMVARLKPGMTRSQVRFTLGTPMIEDTFHKNRWDYIYRLALKGRVTEERKLAVFFKDDRLFRIQGDFPQPSAFSEPPPTFFTPEEAFELPPETNHIENKEPEEERTIDFLRENQENFYRND